MKPSEIAKKIKENNWPSIQDLDVDYFVYEVSPGEYAPRMVDIIQSREGTYDPKFVERQVRKSKSGENISKPAVAVYFPEDVTIGGNEIQADSYKLIDRTHGMVIDRYLGKTLKPTNIVNFDLDLDSDESNLYRLANLLNKVTYEVQPLTDEAIKMELYRLMDKRVSQGKDGHPSESERESFLGDYPQIDIKQWANWVSNHETGGRRDPVVKHSIAELKSYYNTLENMECYKDYHITEPAPVASCFGGVLGGALTKCSEKKKRKLLIPLFAATASQTEGLVSGNLKKKTETRMKNIQEFYHMEDIKIIWMKYI